MEKYSLEKAENQAAEVRKRAVKKEEEDRKRSPTLYGKQRKEPSENNYESAHRSLEFTEYESEKIKEWVTKLVKSWHDDIAPNYVFVTDTSAVPYGYIIKETWKVAYPEETSPKFYRINPGAPIMVGKKETYNYNNPALNKWEITEIDGNEARIAKSVFLLERVKAINPKIIVFDEGNTYHSGLEAIAQFSKDDVLTDGARKFEDQVDHSLLVGGANFSESAAKHHGMSFEEYSSLQTTNTIHSCGRTAKAIWEVLRDKKIHASIWTSRQAAQDRDVKESDRGYNGLDYIYARGNAVKITQKFYKKGARHPRATNKAYHEGLIDEDIFGVPIKDPENRKTALEFIRDLKKLGGEAGERLHLESRK